jgi:hypothetical protein
VRRADNLTTFMCRLSRNLVDSTSWNPQGLSRHCFTFLQIGRHLSPSVKYDSLGADFHENSGLLENFAEFHEDPAKGSLANTGSKSHRDGRTSGGSLHIRRSSLLHAHTKILTSADYN